MKNARNVLLLLLMSISVSTFSQENPGRFQDPVETCISLFEKHRIVALGENHGRQNESDFRLELIENPKFARVVDVIVVEFANPLYQKTIDDYVSGKDVSRENLRKVWRNTTQVGGVWDSPIYEQFFMTVRAVNSKLKDIDRLRVIAADPPVDWAKVKNFSDFKPFTSRGSYPIGVIEKEVYEKDLRALLIFGSTHTELWGIGFTSTLEKRHPGSIAVVMPPPRNEAEMNFIRPYLDTISNPKIINLMNHALGNVKYKDFHSFARFKGNLKDAGQYQLFLGFEKDVTVHVPNEVKEDITYQAERRRRMAILVRGNR